MIQSVEEELRAEIKRLREQNEALIKVLGALASQPPVQVVPYVVPQPVAVPYIDPHPYPQPWWTNPPVICGAEVTFTGALT